MLTKEQKMKMVSDAIDAGFKIEMFYYNADVEKLDELTPIFEGLPKSIGDLGDKSAVMRINDDVFHDAEGDFEARIYLE